MGFAGLSGGPTRATGRCDGNGQPEAAGNRSRARQGCEPSGELEVIVACALTVLSLPGTAAAQDESELVS